ncbi:peptidase S12 family protein, partial [Streptomyces sp. NPDC021056]
MPVPFTAEDTARLWDTFDQVVTDGATPGGVLAYGTTQTAPQFLCVGQVAPECGAAEPDGDTLYDIASLT